jgi:polar amino acid transport system permease protein
MTSRQRGNYQGVSFFTPFVLLIFLCLFSIQVNAAPTPGELLGEGTKAQQEGRLDEALNFFKAVPAPHDNEDPGTYVRARMEAAKIYFSREEYSKSADICREVVGLYPDNIEATNLKSQVDAASIPKWLKFLKDMKTYLPTLLKASVMTLILVFMTMLISPLGGLFAALGRISRMKPLSYACWLYIWIFRGTPLLLQLFFIYYGLPQLGITLKPFTAAALGLGINYSAYLAEIIRGAIESIDPGQMEAAKSIGMTYSQAMRRIIIPQTYKRLVPPVGNEFIALIKDTALVSTIAMVELMRSADQIFNATFNIFILIQAAIIYLIMTSIFTLLFKRIEDRLGVYENR